MMKRIRYILLLAAVTPIGVVAQVDPVERLSEVLPADVAEQVIARVEDAHARDLPSQAVANLALEGVVKGRSAEEVLAALDALVGDLGRAQEAIQAAGRPPEVGEVEAAAAAMRMGVDGAAISELARSQPSGRSLAVPILVIGGLTERGLPADEALAQVAARLAARADDASLMGDFPEVGAGFARGAMPTQVGPALASGRAGFQVPVAGVNVPLGPPSGMPGRPGWLPEPGQNPGQGKPPPPPSGASPIG